MRTVHLLTGLFALLRFLVFILRPPREAHFAFTIAPQRVTMTHSRMVAVPADGKEWLMPFF